MRYWSMILCDIFGSMKSGYFLARASPCRIASSMSIDLLFRLFVNCCDSALARCFRRGITSLGSSRPLLSSLALSAMRVSSASWFAPSAITSDPGSSPTPAEAAAAVSRSLCSGVLGGGGGVGCAATRRSDSPASSCFGGSTSIDSGDGL